MAESQEERPWRESFDGLRAAVKAWYEDEARALAVRYAAAGDLEALDFAELTRRSQALLACEMITLTDGEVDQGTRQDIGHNHVILLRNIVNAAGKKQVTGHAVVDGVLPTAGNCLWVGIDAADHSCTELDRGNREDSGAAADVENAFAFEVETVQPLET